MQLEQMRYLVEIAKSKSLTEASKNLHLSQQALSSSMAKLEAELGYSLFLRNTKGVRLTDKGSVLAKGFNRLIHELEYLLLSVQDKQMCLHKQMICAIAYGLMEAFFADLAEQLAGDDIFESLDVVEATMDNVVDWVKKSGADLGIVTYNDYEKPNWLNDEQLVFTPLFSSRLYVRVSKKMPLSNLQSVSIKALTKENILVYQPKHWSVNSLCQTIWHFSPEYQFTFEESYFLHLQKVKKGLGISFTIQGGPFIRHYDEKNGFYLIPVKEPFRTFIGTLTRRDEPSPVVQYVITYLQIACANDESE